MPIDAPNVPCHAPKPTLQQDLPNTLLRRFSWPSRPSPYLQDYQCLVTNLIQNHLSDAKLFPAYQDYHANKSCIQTPFLSLVARSLAEAEHRALGSLRVFDITIPSVIVLGESKYALQLSSNPLSREC